MTPPTPEPDCPSGRPRYPEGEQQATAPYAAGPTPPPSPEVERPSLGGLPTTVPRAEPEQPGEEPLPDLPGYAIEGVLGRGGMGVVYKARHLALQRTVALKMIRAGPWATPQDVARFRGEAETVARFQHPNIVQIHEVGEWRAEGTGPAVPFCALEFLDGGSLAQKLRGRSLPPREAARLVEQLAQAMHLAHSRNVVHRDLKPANVLLAADGTPKVGDFGLARRLDEESGLSQAGVVVGTPSYMAPEQASGRGHEAGPAADVYALGAILYQCLAGRPPFRGTSVLDTLEQVRSREPLPPSRLRPGMPRDLETICLKCLAKVPEKRYGSARELADDLRRFLNGEPVLARPVGTRERLVKWARRRPAVAALWLVVVLALAGLIGGGAYFLDRLANEVRRAESAEQDAKEQGGKEKAARETAEEKERLRALAALRAESALHTIQLDGALRAWEQHDVARAEELLGGVPDSLQESWETCHLREVCRRKALPLRGHEAIVSSVAVSADGRRIVSGGLDGTVRVWDAQAGQEKWRLTGHNGFVTSVALSADGRRAVSGGHDGTVRVWDAEGGREEFCLKGHTGTVQSVALSADGRRIVSGSHDQTVRVWDAGTGQEKLTLKGHTKAVRSVAVSANGGRIVSGACSGGIVSGAGRPGPNDGELKVWDTATGQATLSLPVRSTLVITVALSPDGTRMVCTADYDMAMLDAGTGQSRGSLRQEGTRNLVHAAAFSADGQRLVTGDQDGVVKFWNPLTGQLVLTLKGHTGAVRGVAVSGDGRRIVSGGEDRTVRLWNAGAGQAKRSLFGHEGPVTGVALSADDQVLVSGSHDRTVRVWDPATGQEKRCLRGHKFPVFGVAVSADGRTIVSAAHSSGPPILSEVKVWETATGREQLSLEGREGFLRSVALSGDGRHVVGASVNGRGKMWDAVTGAETSSFQGPEGYFEVAAGADGTLVAYGGQDGAVHVWDPVTGREKLFLKGPEPAGGLVPVAIGADGRLVLSGSGNMLTVWDLAAGGPKSSLRGRPQRVQCLALSADGQRLLSGDVDGTVRLWDVTTGQEKLSLRGHTKAVLSVTISADGRRIISGGADGTIQVWE